MTIMRISIVSALVIGAVVARAAVLHIPVQSNVELPPGEAYTATLEAADPVGKSDGRAVQAKSCSTKCVQATDLAGRTSIATSLGASMKYAPSSGRVSIEYKERFHPARDDQHLSSAADVRGPESCKFLDAKQTGRWLVL